MLPPCAAFAMLGMVEGRMLLLLTRKFQRITYMGENIFFRSYVGRFCRRAMLCETCKISHSLDGVNS